MASAAIRRTSLEAPTPGSDLRLSDVVAALTYALDITEGQPEGHALRSCVIGMAVGGRLGLDERELSDLYYALLLKDLGCSSNSARISALFGADDFAVKEKFKTHNLDDVRDGARFVLSVAGSAVPAHRRLKHIVDVSLGRGGGTRALIEVRCERGAEIARQIGFSDRTAEAIRALDEHWDGGGHPYGTRGDAIPVLGRILGLAQTVEVFSARGGPEAGRAVARERSGTWFDPEVVAAFDAVQAEPGFWPELARADIEEVVAAVEPRERILTTDEDQLDRVAEAFARVIDAKSPWTFRHSERVRQLALGAARRLGTAENDLRTLSRAALLHDLGKLGISNRILDKEGRLTVDELAAIREHPAHTQHILERVGPFAPFAELAGAHHERVDGNGYHRGTPSRTLSQEARILAVADQYEALTANRPYRDGLTPEDALGLLRKDAGTGVCEIALSALEEFLATVDGRAIARPEAGVESA